MRAARPGWAGRQAGDVPTSRHDAEQKKSFVLSAGWCRPSESSPCCRRNAERDPHVFRRPSPPIFGVARPVCRFPSVLRPAGCTALHTALRAGWLRREPTIWGTGKSKSWELGCAKLGACAAAAVARACMEGRRTEVAFVDRAGALAPSTFNAGRRPTAAGTAPPPPTSRKQPGLAGLGWAHGSVWPPAFVRAAGAAPAGKERCVAGQCDLLKFAAYWLATGASVAPWPVLASVWVGEIDAQYLLTTAGTVWRWGERRMLPGLAGCPAQRPPDLHDSAASQQLREGPISPLQVALVLSPSRALGCPTDAALHRIPYVPCQGPPLNPREAHRRRQKPQRQRRRGQCRERGLQGSTALPRIGQCIVVALLPSRCRMAQGTSEWQPPVGASRCVAILLVSSGAALTCDCRCFGLRRKREKAGGLVPPPSCRNTRASFGSGGPWTTGGIEGLKPRWSPCPRPTARIWTMG